MYTGRGDDWFTNKRKSVNGRREEQEFERVYCGCERLGMAGGYDTESQHEVHRNAVASRGKPVKDAGQRRPVRQRESVLFVTLQRLH